MNADPLSEFTFSNGVWIKNRFALAPLTNQQSQADGVLSDAELNWLRMRADGGFGMLITAASHVQPSGQGFPGQLGCYGNMHVKGLREIADMRRQREVLTILQLFHGGLRSARTVTGVQPTAPSAVRLEFSGVEEPRALLDDEIERIIENFADAARRAHAAGLTGVELHAANGYLFTQFLSQATNLRTDRWGGSLENRAKFLLDTVKAIRRVVPPEFVLGVRLLAEDLSGLRGFGIDDVQQVVQWLAGTGVSYVHLASRDVRAGLVDQPTSGESNVSRLRKALDPRIALIACGAVTTMADAQFAMSQGADLVAVGRAGIGEPAWPQVAQVPGYLPPVFPMTATRLAERGVTTPFVDYIRQFGLVSQP